MKKSRIGSRRRQSETPVLRHLPLVDILVDTQTERQALVVASGLQVLEAMLEEDRVAVCGPRYAQQPERRASRAGRVLSEVVLGGRKMALRRPRVPTRQYGRSLEPLGPDVRTRGTSKRAVSRRFVAQTQAQLDAWRATPLAELDLAVLLLEGVHMGTHCIVVALGIDVTGPKHALGVWEGATENTPVCQGLLTNLQSRGLRTDRSLLVILDGAKALHTAVAQTFGAAAVLQRCQIHKQRNVLEYLPQTQRPWVKAILTRAYMHRDVTAARRLVQDLARRLDADHPSAAASVREGLDESRTVIGLGLSACAPAAIAGHDQCRRASSAGRGTMQWVPTCTPSSSKRNVKRWRGGAMVRRWVAAGVLEATTGFRRVKGGTDMPQLVAALRARNAQLGLGESSEMVA